MAITWKRTLVLATVAMVSSWTCVNGDDRRHISDNLTRDSTSTVSLVVKPPSSAYRRVGSTIIVSCQATGTPDPEITWFKDGEQIRRVDSNSVEEARISLLNAGYLVITRIELSDAGDYFCQAKNSNGEDQAQMKLVVTGAGSSACSDGTTDGLVGYDDIQACAGRWIGHVKRAKGLCSSVGWRVCSPRDSNALRMLTWTDVTHLPGCYAYNAANSLQCTRCHRDNMAGIGSQCMRLQRRHPPSCLSVGRVDVFPSAVDGKCEYAENVTTGVLCCKKHDSNQNGRFGFSDSNRSNGSNSARNCHPRCSNGGTCTPSSPNKCRCPQGYKGASCQIAVCVGGCIPNASCVSPGKCQCNSGHYGPKCSGKKTSPNSDTFGARRPFNLCKRPCLNGGRCRHTGRCKCPPQYSGSYCQKNRRANETRKERKLSNNTE